MRDALGLIATVNDLLLADEMLVELADTSRINEATLRDELRKAKKTTGQAQKPKQPGGAPSRLINSEEYLLLSAVITDPSRADFVLSRIDIRDIRDRTIAALFSRLSVMKDRGDLMRALEDAEDEERTLVTRLAVDPGFDPEYLEKNIEDCLKRIEQRKFNEKSMLVERSGDKELSQSLLIEKKKMIKGTDA
ncbi:MAG: hypothetical protein HZB33_05980 [Nitrospirae bacterium]|nr:hypothetical protein [Nitrospirota bacterium]